MSFRRNNRRHRLAARNALHKRLAAELLEGIHEAAKSFGKDAAELGDDEEIARYYTSRVGYGKYNIALLFLALGGTIISAVKLFYPGEDDSPRLRDRVMLFSAALAILLAAAPAWNMGS